MGLQNAAEQDAGARQECGRYAAGRHRVFYNITDSMIEQIDLAIKTMEGRKLANRDDDSFIKLDF